METTLPSMKLSTETGVNIWHTCSVNEICYNYWTEQNLSFLIPFFFSLPFLWWLNKDFNILLKSYSYLRFCMSRIISALLLSILFPTLNETDSTQETSQFFFLWIRKLPLLNTQTGPNSIRFWLHRTIWSHGKTDLFLLIGLVFYNRFSSGHLVSFSSAMKVLWNPLTRPKNKLTASLREHHILRKRLLQA